MYPKNYCFILHFCLSILFSKFSYAQESQDLIGDWKIIKVELSPNTQEEEKQMLSMITQIFLKSTFHFNANNSFSFDSPDKDLATKNGIWHFDARKKYITIVERVSKGIPGQLMGINVEVSNGKYLFLMEETPLILTVTKKS
jgi:hypothetical protein